jgi:hypothetical protein
VSGADVSSVPVPCTVATAVRLYMHTHVVVYDRVISSGAKANRIIYSFG